MLHRCRSLALTLLIVSLLTLNMPPMVLAQAPVLYSGTWRSGIGIKNLLTASGTSGDDNTVNVFFYDADSGTEIYEYPQFTLAGGAGVELYLPSISGSDLPSGSYSVEVQSFAPVGVMSTNTNYDANMADSYNGVTSATEFFVPGIYNNHNNWTSELIVQNVNSDIAIDVNIDVSGISLLDGSSVGPFTFGPLHIPAKASRSFDTGEEAFPFDAQLGEHFLGSAKVTNTQGAQMAVVLFNTRVAGSNQVVLNYRGMTMAEDADTFLVAPIVYKNFNNGWRSGIDVQNADPVNPVEVTLTVTSQDGTLTATNTQTVLGGEFYEWYLPSAVFDIGTLPDQFIGSATVSTDGGKVVGTVTTTNYNKAKQLSTSPAGQGVALGYIMPSRSSGRHILSAPLVYKNFGTGNWNSSLVVANVGANTATFSLTFGNEPDSPPYTGEASGYTLLPGESIEFYLPGFSGTDGSHIPDGFKGSILVTADQLDAQLTGLVQHTNYGRGVATCYLASGN